MRIVLLGPPGAGKGTQCKRIMEKYGLVHLSSGDILRAERAAKTELGEKAQSYMDSGNLVPDEVIVGMMAGAVTKAADSGYMLDGFPRTVVQAEELDKALNAAGEKIDVLLNLEIDDAVVAERITGRRSCPECGGVYHIDYLKPKVDGVCDADGTELIQRPDDAAEVVRNRLKTYHDQTEPILDYYKGKITVFDIDANTDIDKVTAEIYKDLDSIAK